MRWLLLLLALPAMALAKNRPDDLPHMVNAFHSSERNMITVDCKLTSRGLPRKATCTISQVMFGPPSRETISERLTELEDPKLSKNRADAFKEICGKWPKQEETPAANSPERPFFDKTRAACSAKSQAALVEAFRWHVREIQAQTCKFNMFPPDSREFQQLDADTWQHTTIGGLCDVTLVITLWRPANEHLWNYKQVRVVPPQRDGKDLCPSSATTEFSWRNNRLREIGCRYFD